MTFKKNDPQTRAWSAKGKETIRKNKQVLWEFVASGGARKYQEKLNKQSNGEELSKPEREFMDRVERLFPYVKAKLSSVDMKHEAGESLTALLNALEKKP